MSSSSDFDDDARDVLRRLELKVINKGTNNGRKKKYTKCLSLSSKSKRTKYEDAPKNTKIFNNLATPPSLPQATSSTSRVDTTLSDVVAVSPPAGGGGINLSGSDSNSSDTDSSIVHHKSDDESTSVHNGILNNTLIIDLSDEEFEEPDIPSDDSYYDSPGDDDDVAGGGGNVSNNLEFSTYEEFNTSLRDTECET